MDTPSYIEKLENKRYEDFDDFIKTQINDVLDDETYEKLPDFLTSPFTSPIKNPRDLLERLNSYDEFEGAYGKRSNYTYEELYEILHISEYEKAKNKDFLGNPYSNLFVPSKIHNSGVEVKEFLKNIGDNEIRRKTERPLLLIITSQGPFLKPFTDFSKIDPYQTLTKLLVKEKEGYGSDTNSEVEYKDIECIALLPDAKVLSEPIVTPEKSLETNNEHAADEVLQLGEDNPFGIDFSEFYKDASRSGGAYFNYSLKDEFIGLAQITKPLGIFHYKSDGKIVKDTSKETVLEHCLIASVREFFNNLNSTNPLDKNLQDTILNNLSISIWNHYSTCPTKIPFIKVNDIIKIGLENGIKFKCYVKFKKGYKYYETRN